jgi:hypothetical protein
MSLPFETISYFAFGAIVGGYFAVTLKQIDDGFKRSRKRKRYFRQRLRCEDCQRPMDDERPYRNSR